MIIHILKKPTLDTSVLLNYIPISQLPIISKVLGKSICKQITEYLIINKLYYPNQSDFRPSHSTETALNMVTDSILKSLDENHVAQLLLLDLTSSFDTISYKNIFVRLAEIGISNNALAFIKSYLEDRYYSVVIVTITIIIIIYYKIYDYMLYNIHIIIIYNNYMYYT